MPLFDSAIWFVGSTSALTVVPAVIHADGTAMFHEALALLTSTVVGTELLALMVSAFVVLPFTKFTRTCGVAVFA